MKQPITTPAFTPEAVDWQQQVPFSQRYGDRYHTASGARAQAMHVFLGGCGLPAAWQPTCPDDGSSGASSHGSPGHPDAASDCPDEWIILETGFGLGLNFLSTWAAWRATADRRPARLRFVSTEAHPVLADDLRRACQQTDTTLRTLGERLASRWPLVTASNGSPNVAPSSGWAASLPANPSDTPGMRPEAGSRRAAFMDEHTPAAACLPERVSLDFEDDSIRLDILLGDARERLETLCQTEGPLRAHSVFLDGFDPHKNPVIWSPQTLRAVARHCHPDVRLATWSVARTVRDALQNAGFQVRKRPGLPPKRDCLAATLTGFAPSAERQATAETDTR